MAESDLEEYCSIDISFHADVVRTTPVLEKTKEYSSTMNSDKNDNSRKTPKLSLDTRGSMESDMTSVKEEAEKSKQELIACIESERDGVSFVETVMNFDFERARRNVPADFAKRQMSVLDELSNSSNTNPSPKTDKTLSHDS